MRRHLLAACVGLVWLASGAAVRADPIYSYGFDQSNYTVKAGQPVTVTVFLRETLGLGNSSRLSSASGDGLIAGGWASSIPSRPSQHRPSPQTPFLTLSAW